MARVTGPLLSLDASGKIADTIVYSHWRGIKYARMWLIPTNPDTAGQQTQRGYLTDSVAFWKTMLAETMQGCRNYQAGQSMSGFNYAIRRLIAIYAVPQSPTTVTTAVDLDATTAAQITVTWTTTEVSTGRARLGTTHRSYYETGVDATAVTDHSIVFTGLVADVKYYIYIDDTTSPPRTVAGEYSAIAT